MLRMNDLKNIDTLPQYLTRIWIMSVIIFVVRHFFNSLWILYIQMPVIQITPHGRGPFKSLSEMECIPCKLVENEQINAVFRQREHIIALNDLLLNTCRKYRYNFVLISITYYWNRWYLICCAYSVSLRIQKQILKLTYAYMYTKYRAAIPTGLQPCRGGCLTCENCTHSRKTSKICPTSPALVGYWSWKWLETQDANALVTRIWYIYIYILLCK